MQNKKAKVKITLNDVKKRLSINVLRLQGRSHLFLLLEQNLNPEDQDTKEILINNLANITFIHKDINSEIEDKPYEYLNDYIDNVLVYFSPRYVYPKYRWFPVSGSKLSGPKSRGHP